MSSSKQVANNHFHFLLGKVMNQLHQNYNLTAENEQSIQIT